MTTVREITIAAKDDVFDALFKATTHLAEIKDDAANPKRNNSDKNQRKRIAAPPFLTSSRPSKL